MAPASLEIRNVLMDDCYLRVGGLTGRLYIKEILYGNDNITYAPFRPGTQISGAAVRAVIGHDGAHIKARIRDREGKHVRGAMVITMPAVFASESKLAPALQIGSAVDQNGDTESRSGLSRLGKYYVFHPNSAHRRASSSGRHYTPYQSAHWDTRSGGMS